MSCSFNRPGGGEASRVEELKHLRLVVLPHEQGAGTAQCVEKSKETKADESPL